MTPLLVSADNMTPLPPSDVVRAVQRVDPSLELKWLPMGETAFLLWVLAGLVLAWVIVALLFLLL